MALIITRSEYQQRWDRFIEAREKLIASLEKPIYTKEVSGENQQKGTLKLELDQAYTRKAFYQELKATFNLSDEDIDYENGYFFLDWNTKVSKDALNKFKSTAEKLYFDYESLPLIRGSFTIRDHAFEEINNIFKNNKVLSKSRNSEKVLKLTIDELESIRQNITEKRLSDIIQLQAGFGVILKYSPNYKKLFEDALAEKGFAGFVEILGFRIFDENPSLRIHNLKLREEELLNFFGGFGFSLKSTKGLITATKPDGTVEVFEEKFADLFCTYLYRRFYLHERLGFQESKLTHFTYDLHAPAALSTLRSAFLDKYNKQIQECFIKAYAFEFFPNNDTVYFEVPSKEVLDELIQNLKSSGIIYPSFNQTGFKVKCRYEVYSPLAALETKMKESYPNLNVWISEDGSRLNFQYFFDIEDRIGSSLDFRNFIESLEERRLYKFEYDGEQLALRFLAKENLDDKRFQETEKLSKLVGEEIGVGYKQLYKSIGTLEKFDFPYLHIKLDERSSIDGVQLSPVHANLRGEKEKNFRLFNALTKITSNTKSLINEKLSRFIFDSSKAGSPGDRNILENGSELWNEVVHHSYLPLNDSQIRAVASTIAAPDLALVQGPPGTGKSTAISQILWHHVRRAQKQKILLTSETNMAVDNALEKLETKHHNLVKPIRVGRESVLETEGARYSLGRIKGWRDNPMASPMGQDNIVVKWMDNISSRSQKAGLLPPIVQASWVAMLKSPKQELRQLFVDTYLAHVNIIAATGSSIGDRTSDKGYANFYKQYLEVFHNSIYQSKFELRQDVPFLPQIKFEVAVIDEASKATPPELALPLTYAKKAIVIGDHRQLPPMLDEDDFKTTLESIGEHQLAATFSKEDAEISHFERLFLNPDLSPAIKSTFDTQYRMHPHINEVIKQFYVEDGGLQCGIPENLADLPDLNHPLSRYHGLSHEGFINPDDHLIWIDVDAPEIREGTSRANFFEVEAIRSCLHYLKNAEGFSEFQNHWRKDEDKEIGLISFYGRQLRYLQEMAEEFSDELPVRVRTVDKFQGMERNIVIVSMVRSDRIMTSKYQTADTVKYPDTDGFPAQPSLGFAEFPNRLNVALSRAKRLLIIVGNSRHFGRNECYRRVYDVVGQLGKIINYKELNKYNS